MYLSDWMREKEKVNMCKAFEDDARKKVELYW